MPITSYALRDVTLFTLILIVAMVLSLLAGASWAGFIFLLALGFVWYFFRDPERSIMRNEARLLAPADGKVVEVSSVNENRYLKAEATKISIFMSIFNVHVNRMPCSGRVEFIDYRKGRFFDARMQEASLKNESNMIGLVADSGSKFLLKQVAGLVARRIVCAINIGDRLEQGQRFGMVKFGSRVELFIPKSATARIMVKEGQRVVAGLTVLAELSG
ncbi:MAG: phosphatidylserine decarboxylase family protein [Candidatus Brocadiales bacterium]